MVSHLPIFVNIPAETMRIPDVFDNVGHKYGALGHKHIMRQSRPVCQQILSCDNQTGPQINPLTKNNKRTRREHY